MKTITFSVVTSVSMAITLMAAILSMVSITITGLYAGIFVLLFTALFHLHPGFIPGKLATGRIISRKTILHHSQFLIC